MRTQKPEWQKKIAEERIEILFDLAKKFFLKNPERSRRYVELARKIGLRYNIRLSMKQKNSFCKNCNTFLKAGKTMHVTVDKDHNTMVLKCLNCNTLYRRRYGT